MGAVDERFGEVQLAASLQIFGKRVQNTVDGPVAHPVLKSAVAGLIRRITGREVLPRSTGAKDPQHAVQDVARIAIRPTSNALLHRLLDGKQRPQQIPLVVGEVHRNL